MVNCFQIEMDGFDNEIQPSLKESIVDLRTLGSIHVVFTWILAFLVYVYQGYNFVFILAIFKLVEFLGTMLEMSQMFKGIEEIIILKRFSRPTILFQIFILLFKLLITVHRCLT